MQKDLTNAIVEGKRKYKEKIEQKMNMNDIKSVWKGMDVMSGRKKKSCNIDDSSMTYVNNLNSFYCRFDCHDFERERKECKQGLATNHAVDGHVITIQPNEVKNYFDELKIKKASGPD